MKRGGHFTFVHLVVAAAVAALVSGGGAYAVDLIDSGDIADNSIRSQDLKNRKAVKARDVKLNGLTGKAIKEQTLDASHFSPLAGQNRNGCDPEMASAAFCATSTIRLRSASRVLVIATGEFVAAEAGASLACRIFVANDPSDAIATPGDNDAMEDAFTTTLVTERLPQGSHNVELRCQQQGEDDAQLASASIAVLGISG